MNKEWVYQVRMGADETLEDVVAALTRAVWTGLRGLKPFRGSDLSHWPELHRDFSRVFNRRLTRLPACGTRPECRSEGVYGGRLDGHLSGPTYLLLLRGGLLKFVEGLSALACRRYQSQGGRASGLRRNCREQIQGVLHRGLTPHLYYNEGCSHCAVWKAGRPI